MTSKEILERGWYLSQTLLGYPPGQDANIRYVYRGPKVVAAYNIEMNVWPKEKDAKLQQACKLLNEVEGLE